MGQEPDGFEDERTWQQPIAPRGVELPHERPTEHTATPEDRETAARPDATDPSPTSHSGEHSGVPQGSSAGDSSDSEPRRTHPMSGDSSGSWDSLSSPIFEPGQVVFGKYRLVKKIGEGGMGEVWHVWHLSLESDRALKLIKPELAHNEKGWRRFQREARLMAKINHPNAVAVYDFHRAQSVAYIEMEFIRGRSLADILKEGRGQPMPLEWTARILEQLCAVLHEAHSHVDEATGQPKPIIHRDLKPSNLMLVERKDDTGPPRLKVLDFGIAKIVEDDASPDLTSPGDLLGTPAYMSPDQIRGGYEGEDGHLEIDGRSDLYSTGVVLYHLLTGALPFRGGRMALLAAQLHTAPMPMKEANPGADVPAEVERVVMRCLEKDPERRPRDAHELSEQFLRAAGIGKADPRPAAVVGTTRWRRPAGIAAAAIVLVCVIGLGAMMIARDGRKPLPSPDPPDPDPTPSLRLRVPKGYAAVDPKDIVPGHPGFPVNLRRLDDDVTFVFVRDHVYLPEGYEPESLEDRLGADGWPPAIIRKRDKARFVRIEGATYLRGDPRKAAPLGDAQGNPLTSHYVRVPSFYIQESEVTVGEVEGYLKDYQDDPDLKVWRHWLKKCREDHPDPTRYPAACRSYLLARRYARSVGGLLPTESQWEWAAKSRQEEFLFAWGEDFAPQGAGESARLDNPNANNFDPAPVKQYPSDRTKQNVYDMVGNLRELCADAYVPYTDLKLDGNSRKSPILDGRGVVDLAAPETKIVVRGGSFMYPQDQAMAFYRWREPPADIGEDIGFRVVIECPAGVEGSP